MPIKYGKLSNYRLKTLLMCFCEDLTAIQTSKVSGINRNTVNRYYGILGEKIAVYQESVNGGFRGEIELDESYFGGKGKGRRGRGIAKIPVFGILKRNGRVYTQIIRNATKREIRPIIRQFVHSSSTVYTDRWRAYDGVVVDGYKHYRINHNHGIRAKDFYLHLKECEFRYNERRNIYKKILQIIKLF